MSLANLEKTLITCIDYYQKAGDDDKVAKLKEHLRECRTKSMNSDDRQVLPTEGL
jgi:hypothetical protein